MTKSRKIGRDAITGRIISVEDAKRDPKHSVVETIKTGSKGKGGKKR
jgi:hypothetical protein